MNTVPTRPPDGANPEALRGPWTACLTDGYGYLVDLPTAMGSDVVDIAVVRGSAAPIHPAGDCGESMRLPGGYAQTDVLYSIPDADLGDNAVLNARWEQAQTVAEALNRLTGAPEQVAPPAWVWMAAGRRGLDMHHIDSRDAHATGCGRSTRVGLRLTADDAQERYAAGRCPRCWSDGSPTSNDAPAAGSPIADQHPIVATATWTPLHGDPAADERGRWVVDTPSAGHVAILGGGREDLTEVSGRLRDLVESDQLQITYLSYGLDVISAHGVAEGRGDEA